MRTKLPETCTDPSLIVDLSFTFTPDETLVVDARDTVQINEAFFDALFEHVINMCEPYYAHIFFVVEEKSHVYFDIAQLCITRTSQTHTVEYLTDSDCLGICVSATDLGLPLDGIAYPHPECPIHGNRQS